MKKLLNITELAEMLRIKESTIYDWTHRKKITYVKIGGRLMFKLSDIEKFIDERRVEAIN